jgi:hypothetical protein
MKSCTEPCAKVALQGYASSKPQNPSPIHPLARCAPITYSVIPPAEERLWPFCKAKDKKLKETVHSLLKKVKGMVLDITEDAMLSLCMFP